MADWNSGRDAAYIKPKFVPDGALHGRDDSGGIDWNDNYTEQFGDGGKVTGGAKSYLSASGGSEPAMQGGEESDKKRRAGY
jgi:hypothetical protein